eukprot:SAG31_NODE_3588_length_4093_cov_4.550075_3_plen_131_part_00
MDVASCDADAVAVLETVRDEQRCDLACVRESFQCGADEECMSIMNTVCENGDGDDCWEDPVWCGDIPDACGENALCATSHACMHTNYGDSDAEMCAPPPPPAPAPATAAGLTTTVSTISVAAIVLAGLTA